MTTCQIINVFLVGTGVLAFFALFAPILVYLKTGWELRRREIQSSFSALSILRYFQTFFPTEIITAPRQKQSKIKSLVKKKSSFQKHDNPDVIENSAGLGKKFKSYYSKCFGRKQFLNPLILLLAITIFFLVFAGLALRPYLANLFGESETVPKQWYYLGAMAGFAGGYLYVIRLLNSRWQERTLSPSDLFDCSVRLLISVPVALAFSALLSGPFSKSALYALCFMLGAFPTDTLITFMRRTAASKFNLEDSFDEAATGLSNLQDIRRNQAEIFSKEGVGTILQLAYSDPVDLTIRTGFSFNYVIDCCSQALAWVRFEDTMSKMRKYGLRGAQEIVTFVYELNRGTEQSEEVMDEEQKRAESTLGVLATELKLDKTALNRALEEIAFDPFSQFLNDIWQPEWN